MTEIRVEPRLWINSYWIYDTKTKKFTVKKGSEIVTDIDESRLNSKQLKYRKELFNNWTIKDWKLTEDLVVPSPSYAANVLYWIVGFSLFHMRIEDWKYPFSRVRVLEFIDNNINNYKNIKGDKTITKKASRAISWSFLWTPYNEPVEYEILKDELIKARPELKNLSEAWLVQLLTDYLWWDEYRAVWAVIDWVDRTQEFIDKWVFIIWWDKIWDIADADEKEVKKLLKKYYPDEPSAIEAFRIFMWTVEGEKICIKKMDINNKKTIVYAVWTVKWWFDNSYEYIPWIWHSLPVEWIVLKEPVELQWTIYGKTLQTVKKDNLKELMDKVLDWEGIEWTAINQTTLIPRKEFNWSNILYYWVPGCWKSFLANKVKEKFDDYDRILFHPEYSYSDFIGQILPIKKWDTITYDFVAGPFTKILEKAYKNPDKNYCLIIEELNRWNASWIFWDIFQLLDRVKEGYNKWDSEYPIKNDQITDYLKKNWIEKERIIIPSNLSILATMNSSDQNVFVLDTAFKRRWTFKRIPNNFDDSHPFKNEVIFWTNVTWQRFVETINSEISKLSTYWINWDDKQIWKYFVSFDDIKDKERFAEKVLLYLWEDVVKFNKTLLFKEEYDSIDKLINWFKQNWFIVFKDWIFTSSWNDLN